MIRMRYARWLREHGWIVSGVHVVPALLAAPVLSDIDQHHPVESVRVIQMPAASSDRLDAAIERQIPTADRADARVGHPPGRCLSRLRPEPGRA